MDKAKIKVHLFKVNEWEDSDTLDQLLTAISQDDISQRVRKCGGSEYRLEEITPPANGSSEWILNFVKMRTNHGPGRVSRKTKLSSFEMADEDFFGEDTAVIYNSSSNYAYVQYNHWGVRPHAIAQYLSSYRSDKNNVYNLNIKLDFSAERKYQSQTIQRKIEIGIDLTKMNARDLKARRSLTQLAELGEELGADRLYLTVTVASRKKSSSLKVESRKFLDSAMRFLGGSKDALLRLNSYGSPDDESPFEDIDLLGDRLEFCTDVEIGRGRRVELEERIKAIRRAIHAWRENVK